MRNCLHFLTESLIFNVIFHSIYLSNPCSQGTRRLSENALGPKLFVICNFLSSEYQIDACGKKLQMPRF